MYTVIPTEQFEKDVKYYIKKKGFKHIGEDIKADMGCKNEKSCSIQCKSCVEQLFSKIKKYYAIKKFYPSISIDNIQKTTIYCIIQIL